jgi:hypothetical protein
MIRIRVSLTARSSTPLADKYLATWQAGRSVDAIKKAYSAWHGSDEPRRWLFSALGFCSTVSRVRPSRAKEELREWVRSLEHVEPAVISATACMLDPVTGLDIRLGVRRKR